MSQNILSLTGEFGPAGALPARPVSHSMRGTVMTGMAIVALAFGGFGTWAAVAPLDSAVVAHGQLSVESKRKTIQHLEGGMVKEILVTEGQAVTKGQVLLRLDDTKADSTLEAVQGQYDAATAQLARLQAERDGLAAIAFPPELSGRTDQRTADVLRAQQAEFQERHKSLEAQISVLQQRAAQLNSEIDGYHVQEQARRRQIDLSRHELSGLQQLAEKGYYPKNRLLAMERDIARLEGEMGADAAAQARAEKSISETNMQILQIRQGFREQVAKDLDTVQNRVNEMHEQLISARDMVRRLDVVAPVDGTVQNIRVATKGGVIGAGMELMDIVPTEDRLIIEAQVQPMDIESVTGDEPAEIRFSALKGRNSPVVEAKVTTVSADRLVDQKTGQPYYAARLEVPADQMARLEGRHISPGMPVEVMIRSGERTALDYMLRPVLDSFATSFKER